MRALIFQHEGTGMCALWVAEELVKDVELQNEKRIVVALGEAKWHAALNKFPSGGYYLHLSLSLLHKLRLEVGMEIDVNLYEDTSDWQAPLPTEWQEVMQEDPSVLTAFQALSMGKQRAILFYINRFKTSAKWQEWAVHIAASLLNGETDLNRLTKKSR